MKAEKYPESIETLSTTLVSSGVCTIIIININNTSTSKRLSIFNALHSSPKGAKMNKDNLKLLLDTALNNGVKKFKLDSNINPNSCFALDLISSFVDLPEHVLNNVLEGLRKETELKIFDNGWIEYGGGKGGRIELRDLAHWLLAQSIQYGSSKAIDKLEKFLNAEAIPVIEILALSGLNVLDDIDIVDGIKLVPFSRVPRSQIKDDLENYPTFLVRKINMHGTRNPMPSAALIANYEHKPKILPDAPKPSSGCIISNLEKLLDISRCLTLIGPNGITPISYWTQTHDWVPRSEIVLSCNPKFHEILPSSSVSIYCENVSKLIKSYFNLDINIKNKLRIPIDRLNLAMKRENPIDKAIELGIALESLLTQDLNGDSSISFTLRHRGAILSSERLDVRKKNFKILKECYGLRSSAVHSGRFNPRGKSESLKEGLILCSDLIKLIIEKGGFPDWYTLQLCGKDND